MPSYSKQVPILGRLLKLHDPYGIPLSRVFGHEANDVDVPSDPGSLPVEKTGLTCATGRYMLLLVPGASLANFCFFELAADCLACLLYMCGKHGKRLWNGIMGLSLLKPCAFPGVSLGIGC